MTARRPLLALALALCALRAAAAPLEIVGVSPSGPDVSGGGRRHHRHRKSAPAAAAEGDVRSIAVTFNQPMVAVASAKETESFCPIELSPKVRGRCRWQGTQVVTFEPEKPLPTASAFSVRVAAGIKSRVSGEALAEERAWTFETLRPALLKSKPEHDDRWVSLKPVFLLQFNLPMDPKRARSSIELLESPLDDASHAEKVSAAARRATPEEIKAAWPYSWWGVDPSTANVLALVPSRQLKPDRAYRLHLAAGLRAASGELGVVDDRDVAFESYYSFRYLGAEPFAPFCLPHEITLSFSNPVKYKDLFAALSFEPPVKLEELPAWLAEHTGNQYKNQRTVKLGVPGADLRPDADYTLKVSGKLKDMFGNALGADVSVPLRAQGFCPSLSMPTRIGLLEAYLPPAHPVKLVNVETAKVGMAYVPPEKLVEFSKSVQWHAQAPTPLDELGGVEIDWRPKASRNRRAQLGLDLKPALGGRSSGMVFVQVLGPDAVWHKALLNVTKLGLTAKTSPDSTLLWATFLRTGRPAAGARIEIKNSDGLTLFTGLTGPDGTLSAPGWKGLGIKEWKRWSRPALWVFARSGNDFSAMSTEWTGGLDAWRFGLNYEAHPRPWRYDAAVFAERGVYRAGETVHVKGILRELVRGDWEKAGLASVFVTISDPREAVVFKKALPVSAFSSFDFDYVTQDSAPSGLWRIKVTDGSEEQGSVVQEVPGEDEEGGGSSNDEKKFTAEADFRVEPYKPATFEVTAVPGRTEYMAKDQFTASIDGWYLFGAPMADAPYEWKLRLSPTSYQPPGFEGFSFGPGWWEETPREGGLIASSTGTLDARGKGAAQAALETTGQGRPMLAALEASVMSPERQRLFGRASSLVHGANLYLGVRPSKTFLEKGQPWSGEIAAVRPDGSPAAGLPASASLIRREWLSVQKAGLGGRLEWVTEQRDTEVASFTYVTSRATQTWSYSPSLVGQYFLKVSAKDEQGRPASAGDSFYVTGKGEAWWARSDNDLVELVPDKKSYKPGETARILVKSPFARCRALVSVERERVLERRVVTLEGGADFLKVPIKEGFTPNVYLGVVLLQGRTGTDKYSDVGEDVAKPQAKFGYASLSVDPGGRRLAVEVRTDTATYRPGRRVAATVAVADEAGLPVAAEVTLFAVDEGVLSLTGYGTPDLFVSFYGPRPLLLGSSSLLPYIIGQRSFGEKGESRGGGGGREAGMEGADLRTRFLPTAYWNPSLRSGPDGVARASFTLPDNLSRFRLMAVVHEGRRLGSGQTRFAVAKPLLLRPSLPRLARAGDAFRGGAVVHNYTDKDATVRLSLRVSGDAVRTEGELVRELTVPAGKAVEALWPMAAAHAGPVKLQFRAATIPAPGSAAPAETDGLEWPLSVSVPQPVEVVATSGATETQAKELVRLPSGADSGALEAGLSATAMAGLSEGARFLLEYPYGCLEQRLSRAFPVLVGADLTEAFGLGDLSRLKAKTQEVFAKLGEFQHSSGGFGYWPSPHLPDPYITAYVLHGAALARREGYQVDEAVIHRAAEWLRASLYARTNWAYPYRLSEEYATRAYGVYALALHGTKEMGAFNNLFLRRDQLPLEGQAHLVKAAKLLNAPPATLKALRDGLLSRQRTSPTTLHFEDDSSVELEWIHGSAARATALILQALLEEGGGFPGDDKAVRWLMEERKSKGRWRTTQENSAALYALQDYYRRYEKQPPAFAATVSLAQQAWKEEFSGRTLETRRRAFEVSGAGPLEARLSKSGTGRLYYVLRLSYPAPKLGSQSEGFTVRKEVRSLYGTGSGARLKPGERAVVTLTVTTPQDRTFVVLDDPVPAGFEIVDTSFAVEGAEDAAALGRKSGDDPWWGGFSRSENYDDRIAVFSDYLTAGTHSYSYLVQATTPGRFWGPATRVEQMYQPEVFGTAAGADVQVGE